MLKVLLKKQLTEVFKGYFYDAKKNRMRSKGAVVGWFIFFLVIMVGLLGGIFTALALSMCGGMTQAGMGWLYFLLLAGIAVALGAFGSVFNTYSGLYLSKDNDLLLSLPIPVRDIIAARLMNVYVMGAMYAATVFIPALIVYWMVAGASLSRVLCGILQFFMVTVFVLILSCLLGWVVARFSLKLKNKSIVTVLVSLVFIVGYYVIYFRANAFIREMVRDAALYGEKIRGAAYGLYLFGRVGEGDWLATAVFTVLTAVLFALVWLVLSRSFLRIATASAGTKKARYVEKTAKQNSVFGALQRKEFARFFSSPNYMLNCGLGILLIPASGILALVKGPMAADALSQAFAGKPGCVEVLFCTVLFLLAALNDIAAPSVSLEGKSLWLPQSLPVEPRSVLRAKASVHLILTGIPMLFAAICLALVLKTSGPVKVLLLVAPLLYSVFSALCGTVIGVRMPLLRWTNENAPIKQSGAVMLSLFGGWAVAVVFAGLYLAVAYRIGPAAYLLLWAVLFSVASLFLLRWLDTKGAATFAAL